MRLPRLPVSSGVLTSAFLLLALLVASSCSAAVASAASASSLSRSAQPVALRLHNLFSGNMTLARSPQRAVMWGTASPGSTVSVTVDGVKSGQADADATGHWTVTLTAHPPAVSTRLVVSDGSAELQLLNVAFGDVFFCSGQSNMQMPLDYSFGSAEEIAHGSDFPNVRLFSMAGNQFAAAPLYESRLSYPTGWVLPSPKTLQYAPGDVFNYFSGVCWYAGKDLYRSINAGKSGADIVPIGLIQGAYAGAGVVPFLSPEGAGKCGAIPPSSLPTQQPTVIYNAMVAPYIKLRISAHLWYQGESDTGNTTRYACTFPALIEDWRAQWKVADLPFIFVMLHPYNGGQGLADIRFVQKAALALPRTAVASAIDLGDLGGPAGQIHPRNKSYVGQRLSLVIQRELYGMNVVSEGPTLDLAAKSPITVTVTPGSPTTVRVELHFSADRASAGLHALQTPNCTQCCSDRRNLASIRLLNDSTNVIYNPTFSIDAVARRLSLTFTTTSTPTAGQVVQVAMSDVQWPQCVLYNDAELPALPLRATALIPSSPTSHRHRRPTRAARLLLQSPTAASARPP